MGRTYEVTFTRIGRNHHVPPQTIAAAGAEDMAFKLHRFARKFLASRLFEVSVDMEEGTGIFLCGFHSGGTFTFKPIEAVEP